MIVPPGQHANSLFKLCCVESQAMYQGMALAVPLKGV